MFDDRATLDRFRAGDRATLALVYREHAPEIGKLAAVGFSFRSGDEVHRFFGYREPHEQQDCVQEVFIRAFSERGRMGYDGLSSYGGYLRGILKNLVIDEFRKRKHALAIFTSEDAADSAESPAESPEVEVHRAKMNQVVRGFVDKLPEREKRFVALRFTEGFAQEDVAKRMKVGRSTVRTLEERVRKKLHAQLAADGLLEQRGALRERFLPALLLMIGGLRV